jgi:hypothetical protein
MGEASGFQADTPGLYVSLEGGSITGSQLINLPVFAMLEMNPWLIAVVAIVLVPILLFVFRWVLSLPRRAADMSPEERAELKASGWPIVG